MKKIGQGIVLALILMALAMALWKSGSLGGSDKGKETGKRPSTEAVEGKGNKNEPNGDGPVKEGLPAPNFPLQSLDGKKADLINTEGKPVLINFWASWCPPCKLEMPDLQRSYRKYGEDVQFAMVNLTSQDDMDEVREYLGSEGFTFPVLLDTEGKAGEKYGISLIPTSYVVDRNGVILRRIVGPMSKDQMTEILDGLIKR